MSKRKKTRQQKVIADLRRKLKSTSHLSSPLQTIDVNKVAENNIFSQEKQINTKETLPTYMSNNTASTTTYSYFLHDLKKTFALTTSIIVIELLLFFLLRNHVILLPNLNF